jgi:hypothetical protein
MTALATLIVLLPQAGELSSLPALEEASRLPPPWACIALREQACEAAYQWKLRFDLFPNDQEGCYRRLCEARLVHEFWQEACWAQLDNVTVITRRKSLRRLKELIGPDAFYQGEWPWP